MSGIELQEVILRKNLIIPITFITGTGEISSAVSALKKGAVDFLQKPIKEDFLCSLVSAMLTKAQIDREQHLILSKIHEKFKLLTLRESQILERIVTGKINKQVAADLNISVKTVEAHRASIMDKLQVKGPTKLLEIAIKYQEAKDQRLI